MSATEQNLNLVWARLMIEELVRCGVRTCCMASGSRNAPLVVAAAEHARMTTVIHYDERGAAYFALGYARATRSPCAWLTTSGTAAANGLPAVVEASNAGVPMLMLTADRPPELRDVGANQAIDQVKLFGGYPRWFVDMPCPTAAISPEFVLTTVDQAVNRACTAPAGPVHLNCMYREPLVGDRDLSSAALDSLQEWSEGDAPYTSYPESRPGLQSEALRHIASIIEGASRGLLLVGQLDSMAETSVLSSFAAGLGWPVITEVTSGLRLRPAGYPRVPYYDQLLLSDAVVSSLAPDTVLHVGGRLTSTRLQQFLEKQHCANYIHVGARPDRQDPGHLVTLHAQSDPSAFCTALSPLLSGRDHDDWVRAWDQAGAGIDALVDTQLTGGFAVSEPGVAWSVSRLLPPGHGLYLGSSMPIRDMDMFGYPEGKALSVAANRGASGIDGTLASAAGYAAGLDAPVTAIAGDLACLHDLNSLNLVAKRPITLVIINNDGGGIFSFLPIAEQEDVFETHFGTPHGFTFEGAAKMYGIDYASADTQAAFDEAYQSAVESGQANIIEIKTDRDANLALHRKLETAIVKHVEG